VLALPVRITFNGGSLTLSAAGSFTGKDGELVKLDAALIIIGVRAKPIRLPLDVVEATIALRNNDAYKEFAKKSTQPKP